jgi:hypothetical protein
VSIRAAAKSAAISTELLPERLNELKKAFFSEHAGNGDLICETF